jgi:hypothetical protein
MKPRRERVIMLLDIEDEKIATSLVLKGTR